MYGVTQSESFHLLNAATLQFGLTVSLCRKSIIGKIPQQHFNKNPRRFEKDIYVKSPSAAATLIRLRQKNLVL